MPYHIGKSDQCPASKPHAVIKDDDGKVMGCHATKTKAQKQMGALYMADGALGADDVEPSQWEDAMDHLCSAVEDEEAAESS